MKKVPLVNKFHRHPCVNDIARSQTLAASSLVAAVAVTGAPVIANASLHRSTRAVAN